MSERTIYDGVKPMTAAKFRRLSALHKGYICYMLGAHYEQPNVPDHWDPPTPQQLKSYDRGQALAIQHAQDCP